MIVMGVDPGSRVTGYGVVSCGSGVSTVMECGVIRLSQSQSLPERIGEICRVLEDVLIRCRPQRIAIETAFVGRSVRAAMTLGQVRGAVVALAMRMGIGIHEYAPREVKLAVTGSGSAGKEQVAAMLVRLLDLGVAPESRDITDALGIAFCDILRSSSGVARQQALLMNGGANKNRGWSAFIDTHPERVA